MVELRGDSTRAAEPEQTAVHAGAVDSTCFAATMPAGAYREQTRRRLMQKKALWPGRFQPPTIAHMHTAEVILDSGWNHLTIAVVYDVARPSNVDPRWKEYLEISDRTAFGPGKIIFNADEVKEMWEAGIVAARLDKQVRVVTMARTQYNPNLNTDFPPFEYDYIVPTLTDGTDELDKIRRALYAEVFNRPIKTVVPTFSFHNSQIRESIRARGDKAGWESALPPGTYEMFMDISGPQRVAEADKIAAEARKKS